MIKNIERQKILDEEKWLLSEQECCDKSGEMKHCFYCLYQNTYLMCQANQEERESGCLCAKAYNKWVRYAKKI
jgi:hypothetical protein